MGKIDQKIRARQLAKTQHQEGLIRVLFCFGGKNYVREHTMNPQEVQAAKDMLEAHGPDAFDSATIRAPIKGTSMFGEYVATEALKEYARNHWVPPVQHKPAAEKPNVFTPQLVHEQDVSAREIVDQLVKNHEERNQVDNAEKVVDAVILGEQQLRAVDDTAGLEPL